MSAHSSKIFSALLLVPKGKVTTYKTLAEYAGIKNPRVVGNILHKNTDPEKYPCHRVVKSDGSIAAGYAMGGPSAQRRKLKAEGVKFLKNGSVDLAKSLYR